MRKLSRLRRREHGWHVATHSRRLHKGIPTTLNAIATGRRTTANHESSLARTIVDNPVPGVRRHFKMVARLKRAVVISPLNYQCPLQNDKELSRPYMKVSNLAGIGGHPLQYYG